MVEYNYKTSNIQFIDKIPYHWELVKMKRVLNEPLKYGANESAELDDKELPRYIRITDFGNDGKLKEETFKSLPIEKAKEYMLTDGDVLFARSGATVGKTFQFKSYEGEACFAGYLIKATPRKWQLDSDFLYYYTKSIAYEEWKNIIFTQATIQNIGADKYQYLDIPFPPLPEQKTIADYLDKTCERIDKIIEIKQKQLKLLELNQASALFDVLTRGVNKKAVFVNPEIHWMAKMPKHWKKKRVKDVVSLKSGNSITSTDINEFDEFPVYGGNGFRGFTNSYTHEGGFAIIGRQGALCGNINYAKGKFWASEHAVVGTPIHPCSTLWIGELLRVMNLNQYSNAAAQPGLAVERIKQLYLPVPPYDEQIEIASYIEDLTGKIKKIKKNINSQITTLKSYRKSLIHECVTGKKQVWDSDSDAEEIENVN